MARSKSAELARLARRGPLRPRDLDAASIPRAYLRRMEERGELERVGRGLYRLRDAPASELHSIALVAKRVPRATVCLLSALQIHELTTEAPHAVWIMIGRHARAPRIDTPEVVIARASGRALEHGVEILTIEGVPVRITSAAKTVADCFRYRRRVGLDVALVALREYLRTRRGGMDALVAAARADRALTAIRPYLEALA